MTPANRQMRGRLTGDPQDIAKAFEVLMAHAEANGWNLTFEDRAPFGDYGPIHKVTFGFTTKP